MHFDIVDYFSTLDISKISISENINIGVTYGFIFFLSAMIIGIGLNYAFRLLKI